MTPPRIATVGKPNQHVAVWACHIDGSDKVVYLLSEEFAYSPVQTGDRVELTYTPVSEQGAAGWIARKIP